MSDERTYMRRVADKINELGKSSDEKTRMLEVAAFVLSELSVEMKLQVMALEARSRQVGAK